MINIFAPFLVRKKSRILKTMVNPICYGPWTIENILVHTQYICTIWFHLLFFHNESRYNSLIMQMKTIFKTETRKLISDYKIVSDPNAFQFMVLDKQVVRYCGFWIFDLQSMPFTHRILSMQWIYSWKNLSRNENGEKSMCFQWNMNILSMIYW